MSYFERNITTYESKAVATGAARTGAGVDPGGGFFGDSGPKPGVSAFDDAKDHFIYAAGGHLG